MTLNRLLGFFALMVIVAACRGQNPIVPNRVTVLQFPLATGINEVFKEKQTVRFTFYESSTSANPALCFTRKEVDLSETVSSGTSGPTVDFRDIDLDDSGKSLSVLFPNQNADHVTLWYKTQVVPGRNASRMMSATIQLSSLPPPPEEPKEPQPQSSANKDMPFKNDTHSESLIVFDYSAGLMDSKGVPIPVINLDRGKEFLNKDAGPSNQSGTSIQLVPGRRIRVNVVYRYGAQPEAKPVLELTTAAPSVSPQIVRLADSGYFDDKSHGLTNLGFRGGSATVPIVYYTFVSPALAVPSSGTLKIAVDESGGQGKPDSATESLNSAAQNLQSQAAGLVVTDPAAARRLTTAAQQLSSQATPPKTDLTAKAALASVPEADSIVVAPAPTWNMQNAFSTEFVVQQRGRPAFAVSTPVYTFNSEWRIDGVAVFPTSSAPSTTTTAGSGSSKTTTTTTPANSVGIGQGLSFNTYLGSLFKVSGRHPIGFPVRLSLTAGIVDWSFADHKLGTRAFFGAGISIPLGGKPSDVADTKTSTSPKG